MIAVGAGDFDKVAVERDEIVPADRKDLATYIGIGWQTMGVGGVSSDLLRLERRFTAPGIFVPAPGLGEFQFVNDARDRHGAPAEGEVDRRKFGGGIEAVMVATNPTSATGA